MAIKKTLTKTEFDALPDVLKAEYKVHTDGSYKLEIEGDNSAALAFETANEKTLRLAAEARLKEFETKEVERQTELDTAKLNAARAAGDLKTVESSLNASWQQKLDAANTSNTSQVAKLKDHTIKQLVDGVANSMAAKLNPKATEVWLPHIKSRLVADFEGETPVTRVLDKDGKPSNMTVEQLHAELVATPAFKSIIAVSQASGGQGKQTQSNPNPTEQPANIAKMSPQAMAAHIDSIKANTQEA